MIENYVISLKDQQERRNHISKQFKSRHTNFQFFDAVTPNILVSEMQKLNLSDEHIGDLSIGELACALSHIKLWHLAVEKNLEYIAIFEDDVHLGEDFGVLMADNKWLEDIDVLKLEKFRARVELSFTSRSLENSDRKVYQMLGKNLGCGGYVLSLDGAKYLISYIEKLPKLDVIDAIVFNQRKYAKSIAIHQLRPAVVIQDSVLNRNNITLASDLQQYRDKKKECETRKKKLSTSAKIKKEAVRFIRSFRMKSLNFR